MSDVTVEQGIEESVSAIFDRGWGVLRIGIALILLTASVLKAYQLATVPLLGEGLFHARWSNILVVEFELIFGIWLLFGQLPRLTWLATVGCFSIFTAVSLYKTVLGEANCGCWGMVEVDPRITVAFDLVVIGLLLWFRPRLEAGCWRLSSLFGNVPSQQLVLCFGLSVVMGGAVYGWIAQMRYERLSEVGQVLEGNVVKLEPSAWIGKEFPLRDYVVDGQDLMIGKWTVLLSSLGCSDCEKVKKNLLKAFARKYSATIVADWPWRK